MCADIISELNKELKSASVNILYKSDKLYTKDEIVNALVRNEIQIFVGLEYVEEDKNRGLEYIRFPLYSVREVFTILKNKKASSVDDILKSKIGVIQSTYPEKKLSQLFGGTISKSFVHFQTPIDAISALNNGQIGAIFWASLIHGYYASAYPEKYDTFNYPGEKFYHYIVVNRSVSSKVKELLYKAIKKINESGTMKELIRKYKLDNYILPGNVIEVLTVNWKPYEWYDEKEQSWKGIDVDAVKTVFKSLGFDVVFITYPWERCLEFMKFRMFDGIMTLRKTQTREEFLIFPKEILSTGNDVLYKLKSNRIILKNLEDIPKEAICTYIAGYAYPEWFWNAPFRKELVEDDVTGFLMLKNRRADFFICNLLVGTFLTRELGMENIVEYFGPFTKKIDYYIAFSKNFHGLFLSEIFSKQWSEFKKTKEYENILGKYGIKYSTLWY